MHAHAHKHKQKRKHKHNHVRTHTSQNMLLQKLEKEKHLYSIGLSFFVMKMRRKCIPGAETPLVSLDTKIGKATVEYLEHKNITA